jgi:hypothetical protein
MRSRIRSPRKFQFGNTDHVGLAPGGHFEMTNPGAPGWCSVRARTWRSTHRDGWCRACVALWGEDVEERGHLARHWEIEPVGDSCRLLVTHDQLREGANDQLYGGWPMILSGLKTWLETGEVLTTPGSLMYGSAS